MAKERQKATGGKQKSFKATKREPRSLAISNKGIATGSQFAALMSALMSDILEGRVTPSIGNATCNAGGKLLKVVEMQYKYGTDGPGQVKVLQLTEETKAIGHDNGDEEE